MVLLQVVSLHLIHADPGSASLTEQAGRGVGIIASVWLREDASQLLAWLTEAALQLLPQLLILKGIRSRCSVWDDGNACFGLHRNRRSDLTP